MKILFRILFIFLIASCENEPNTKLYNFNFFDIELDSNWIIKKRNEVHHNTEIYDIVNLSGDTIYLSVNGNVDISFLDSKIYKVDSATYTAFKTYASKNFLENSLIVENLKQYEKISCIYDDSYAYFDTIDEKVLAIYKPKKNIGYMGFVFEAEDSNVQMFVKNPSEETKVKLDIAIKTIKWK